MKKLKMILVVLLIVFIVLLIFLFFNRTVLKNNSLEEKNEIISSKEKKQLIEDIVNDINEEYDNDESENTKDIDKGYDQYFVASGYSGASNNVYYTKDRVLYHLVISTGEITKVAEGVSKIENGKGVILVYKGTDFKLFEEDNYLTYVD